MMIGLVSDGRLKTMVGDLDSKDKLRHCREACVTGLDSEEKL